MSFASYAFSTGSGLNPYLLKHIKDVVGAGNAPELKVSNLGFLNLLNSQRKTLNISAPEGSGRIQNVDVKYMQRLTPQMTQTSDTCSVSNVNPYLEVSVPLNIYRQQSIYIEDSLIAQYEADANSTQSLGLPPTPVMMELLNQIYAGANSVLEGLNQDLQNQMTFGVNQRTGSSAASTINITLNTTNLPLTDGLTQILTDGITNEFNSGKLQMYGNGLPLNFFMQQNAKGLAQNGLITKIEAMGVDFYYDVDSTSIIGANEAVVISPDSVQIVEFMRFKGIRSGMRGGSHFGSIVLPMPGNVTATGQQTFVPMEFDFQLNYLNCPTDVAGVNNYYGTPISGYRGYQMIISKYAGLFQTPTNAYRAGDNLAGTNGALRYLFTNV